MKNFVCKIKIAGGFSLLEIIISVSIVTVGILAITNLFFVLTKSALVNKNKTIAIYLAEENMEIIRQLRDTNWLNSMPWDQNIYFNPADKTAVLKNTNDARQGFEIVNKNNNSKKIYESSTGGYFQKEQADPFPSLPEVWKETKFTRWLAITKPNAETIEVVSYVYYNDEEAATVTAVFKDWKP